MIVTRSTARVLGPGAATVGLIAVLHRLGSGSFEAPPIHSWSRLIRWYEESPPEVMAVAILRLIALALSVWLLVAWTLQLLAAIPTLRPLGSLADVISPRSLQRLGHGLAGISLTAGLAAVVPSAGIPLRPLPVAATVVAGDDDPDLPPPSPASVGDGTATMRLVGDRPSPAVSQPVPVQLDQVPVEMGDSFWSIAVEELTRRGGAAPSDRQVAPYWRRLVEHNRATLVDPTNPDLIYPGQVVSLPPG